MVENLHTALLQNSPWRIDGFTTNVRFCIEFLNILAAVSNCGYANRMVRLMLETSISAVVEHDDNLSAYALSGHAL